MEKNIVIIALGWCMYGFVHSALATTAVKEFARSVGIRIGFFKVLYNIIALGGLYALIKFQTSVITPKLLPSSLVIILFGALLSVIGIAVMGICIFKYFKQMNGFSREVLHPSLIITGLHRYVRHPLYSGTFVFITGLFFLFPFFGNLVAISVIIAYTLIAIKFEEAKLVLTFGEDYKRYQHRVPKILPDFCKRP